MPCCCACLLLRKALPHVRLDDNGRCIAARLLGGACSLLLAQLGVPELEEGRECRHLRLRALGYANELRCNCAQHLCRGTSQA